MERDTPDKYAPFDNKINQPISNYPTSNLNGTQAGYNQGSQLNQGNQLYQGNQLNQGNQPNQGSQLNQGSSQRIGIQQQQQWTNQMMNTANNQWNNQPATGQPNYQNRTNRSGFSLGPEDSKFMKDCSREGFWGLSKSNGMDTN